MINKTAKTIRENPKVFLVFFTTLLITTAGTMIISALMLSELLLTEISVNIDMATVMGSYIKFIGLNIVFLILVSIFIWPSIGNYIYEMCSGKLEKGWYIRGLKKGWWKILVLGLLALLIIIVVFFLTNIIFTLLVRSAFLTVAINIIIMLVVSIYSILAATAIFAEDSFSYALGNTFTLGSKYFFKLLGTILLAYIPVLLISLISTIAGTEALVTIQGASVLSWIMAIINFLYGVFITVFILTYSMNNYLEERSIFYPVFDVPEESIETEEAI